MALIRVNRERRSAKLCQSGSKNRQSGTTSQEIDRSEYLLAKIGGGTILPKNRQIAMLVRRLNLCNIINFLHTEK